MKHLLKLIIILSLFAQVCYAQKAESLGENKTVHYDKKIESVKEYKVLHDSIASLVKLAKKDSINYVGITFLEFEKRLDKCGLKITKVGIRDYDRGKVYPQHVYGIALFFSTKGMNDFVGSDVLQPPYIIVNFTESKPYEKTFNLIRQYRGFFNEEFEALYADAVVQSLYFHHPDDIYLLKRTTE